MPDNLRGRAVGGTEFDMGYVFHAETVEKEEQILSGVSRIRKIHTDLRLESDALVLGQLIKLFGEPLYMSRNLESFYGYCISAADETDGTVYLAVYNAGSGPVIGGSRNRAGKKAADALAEYILRSEPADYQYEGYDMDGPCIVRLGVIDGVPYGEEEELAQFSEEERKALFA